MNPGLLIKLRPAGPWRIGPDSGARNKVDVIYHSDSLYSAVTGAMSRMGGLEEWLDATARASAPAVCFSSCFPFLDEIRFVVPPRTTWPPVSPSLMSAGVRWKSARFVPLPVVQTLLAREPLDRDRWSVDGASACLVPTGRPGPFRTGMRWSAAVDRLSGASERHGVACIEFRPGAGLWTVASFSDEPARDRWLEPLEAAFRLLADSGFGGERSRGWGRAEAPEFIEGVLPDLIVPARQELPVRETAAQLAYEGPLPLPPLEPPPAEPPAPDPDPAPAPSPDPEPGPEPQPPVPEPEPAPEPVPVPPLPDPAPALSSETESAAAAAPAIERELESAPMPAGLHAHWLLSLFSPAPADSVDWTRGNYVVLARSGRVESPAGSGELKKQVRMLAEGSVVYAPSAPCGAAADVAPDGFVHPVFRAGFALAIPLPEVR